MTREAQHIIDAAEHVAAHCPGLDEGTAALMFCARLEHLRDQHAAAELTLTAALHAWRPNTKQ